MGRSARSDPTQPRPALVWDCFFFNNELELLEFRLRELNGVVDRFVVVEADLTFAGASKPFVFAENQARFSEFAEKIVPVHAQLTREGVSRWDRENEQRWAVRDVIDQTRDDDLILLGDVDEIPRRESIDELSRNLTAPVRMELAWSVYYANWVLPTPWLNGPLAFRRKLTDHHAVQSMLGVPWTFDPDYCESVLPGAGRHLSSIGSTQVLVEKFQTYAHAEFDNELDRDLVHLERCFRFGVHFEGRQLLTSLSRGGLDPLLERLHDARPEWFNFRDPAARWQSEAYRAYTWVRRKRWLPRGLFSFLDRHPGAVTGAGAPAFLALEASLELRRKMRKPRHRWKAWRYVDATGVPLPESKIEIM